MPQSCTCRAEDFQFVERFAEAEACYRETYGADSPQVRDSFHGTQFEPKVALDIFQKMLAEQPKIVVHTEWALDGVKNSSNSDGDRLRRVCAQRSPG